MDGPDLASLREEYSREGLTEEAAGDDPTVLLGRWIGDAVAAGVPEPIAMALATATPAGRPSVRMVLLKGYGADGLVFFTHYESRKGLELAANPWAAATLWWHDLQRQVRVEGSVSRVTADESDAYFASRPRGSQIGAVASPQSRPIADRGVLDQRVAEVSAVFGDGEVLRPEVWGGFRIALDTVEFWQGRESRLHDRLRFDRERDGWHRRRLAP